jgi:hypothetical protein
MYSVRNIFTESTKSMEIFKCYCSSNSLQTLSAVQEKYDNDNAPPRGGTPISLPGPLPASIVFPMKLARGGIR